jgi:hypothetical protein
VKRPFFFVVFVVAMLAATVGCGRKPEPIQPLQHVAEGAKLRVRFHIPPDSPPADGDDKESENRRATWAARRAVVDQLRTAGYEVVDGGKWDVKMELTIRLYRYKGLDPEFTETTAVFLDHKKQVVDRISFSMKPGAAPASEPIRIANVLVNGVVESPKLAAYASERAARRAAKAKPQTTPATEPSEEAETEE